MEYTLKLLVSMSVSWILSHLPVLQASYQLTHQDVYCALFLGQITVNVYLKWVAWLRVGQHAVIIMNGQVTGRCRTSHPCQLSNTSGRVQTTCISEHSDGSYVLYYYWATCMHSVVIHYIPSWRSKRWNSLVHPLPSEYPVCLMNVDPGWVGPVGIPNPP